MKRVVTFGEIMLRLAPPNFQRFIQTDSYQAIYGGGEANVAVSLSNYGLDSYFVTKVPDNDLGQSAINQLRRYGVNTSYIKLAKERLGIYFLEYGASQRASKVIYDRDNTAISNIKPGDIIWQEVLKDVDLFHFTGITPALGEGAAAATLEALKTAKKMGVTVSVDLNYRKKLWTPEKAGEVMGELLQYVDIVIGNEEDAEKVFGIKAAGSEISAGHLSDDGYKHVASELAKRFNLKHVAITLRESYSASDNGWRAMLYNGEDYFFSKKYDVHIVDRVGGGDAFAGGLLYSLLEEYSPQYAIEFATAASCLKHTIHGDFNHVSLEEVKTLVNGDGSGRVQR
ncbi:MAG: 2-dehydro-3-deoxygluconokinase [Desulfitibacter sp. BRH_c19]|nr:MAG: 2-dehydro-3-deoxygluconokinase [Desulfitibacter sp. BRH_c19]